MKNGKRVMTDTMTMQDKTFNKQLEDNNDK